MKKRLLFAFVSAFAFFSVATAQQKTTLSANIDGYRRSKVFFDCMQTPLISHNMTTLSMPLIPSLQSSILQRNVKTAE